MAAVLGPIAAASSSSVQLSSPPTSTIVAPAALRQRS